MNLTIDVMNLQEARLLDNNLLPNNYKGITIM